MLKLKLQYFGHLMWRVDSLEKTDAGRDWGQEEKGTTEDEMAGWHHWFDRRESGWTLGVGDGQGGLACCDSWGHKESDTTERLNWTERYGFIPGSGRSPGGGNGNPFLPEFLNLASILAWKIQWTEEPVRLQSMGSQEFNTTELITHTHAHTHTHIHTLLFSCPWTLEFVWSQRFLATYLLW